MKVLIAVTSNEDVIEGDRVPWSCFERRNTKAGTGFSPELLTACLEHCVHVVIPRWNRH